MKIHVITLGCPKNIVDSEYLMGGLAHDKVAFVNDPFVADVIIINTCSFILSAREEAIDTILEAVQLKQSGRCCKIFVVGCLPQKYRRELEHELPQVDGFFDELDFSAIAREIAEKLGFIKNEIILRKSITPHHYAYLKIADGCSNRCSYCTIPSIKGDYSSKDIRRLIEEAEILVNSGVRELIVIAQDSTNYGRDQNNGISLASLLRHLCTIDQFKWIRLLYAHPAHVDDELIYLMRDEEKLCKYIDLPLQHISDHILKQMGRNVSSYQIERLIEKLRANIPNLAIRTTLMIGFPGETEKDFKELLKFVNETKFERLGVFKYSQEDDTVAALLPDQVNEEQKEDRLQEIIELQRMISLEKNKSFIDNNIDVIIDEFDEQENNFIGRSQWDCPLIDYRILVKNSVTVGSFFSVKIEDARDCELIGSVTSE